MPDVNKHAALVGVGFKIQPTCGSCTHHRRRLRAWGKCGLLPFDHAKHGSSHVGTPSVGWCPRYVQDLRSITLSAGEDYAARYAEEG